jgi:hypothetical protein
MEFGLPQLEELLDKRELVLEKGVKLACGDRLRPEIYREDGVTVFDFNAPFVYIIIEELGGINILDIKRKVNKILIAKTTITLVIDSFPDITRDR